MDNGTMMLADNGTMMMEDVEYKTIDIVGTMDIIRYRWISLEIQKIDFKIKNSKNF